MNKVLELANKLWNKIDLFNNGTQEEQKVIMDEATNDMQDIISERFIHDIEDSERDEYIEKLSNIHDKVDIDIGTTFEHSDKTKITPEQLEKLMNEHEQRYNDMVEKNKIEFNLDIE